MANKVLKSDSKRLPCEHFKLSGQSIAAINAQVMSSNPTGTSVFFLLHSKKLVILVIVDNYEFMRID